MAKNRTMAIKHAMAKKAAMREFMSNANDFSQTSWGTTETMRKFFRMKDKFE